MVGFVSECQLGGYDPKHIWRKFQYALESGAWRWVKCGLKLKTLEDFQCFIRRARLEISATAHAAVN